MASRELLRRAYVDLLHATGQLQGIDHLFLALGAEGFEPGRFENVEARRETLARAALTLLEGEDDTDVERAPALSRSDWLRAFAVLAHHRHSQDDGIEDLLAFSPHVTKDGSEEPGPESARAALVSIGKHVSARNTFDLEEIVGNMTTDEHSQLVDAVGHQVVHSVTRQCVVETIPMPDGKGRAIRIEARYVSDRPPSAFVYPANPLNWPKCNAFFKSMDPVGDETKLEKADEGGLEDPDHVGYRRILAETVDFGYMQVTTHLDVVFYKRTVGQDVKATGMTFDHDKNHPNDVIDVDYGYLSVESADGGSLVKSSKTLRFTDRAGQGGEWAMVGGDWACRLGWLDTMEQMNMCTGD